MTDTITVTIPNDVAESAALRRAMAEDRSAIEALDIPTKAPLMTEQAAAVATQSGEVALKHAAVLASQSDIAARQDVVTQAATQVSADAATVASKTAEAMGYENLARKWADEGEDTAVMPGSYSAKHWAAKAEGFAQATIGNLVMRGAFSALGGAYPHVCTPDTPDLYYIAEAGTIFGITYEVGDFLLRDPTALTWRKIDGVERPNTDLLTLDDSDTDASAKAVKTLQDNKLEATANAVSATVLQTARNVSVTGAVEAAAQAFDGSTDLTITVAYPANQAPYTQAEVDDALALKLTAATGVAFKAAALENAREVAITGVVETTTTATFDGSGNLSLTTSYPAGTAPYTQAQVDTALALKLDATGTAPLATALANAQNISLSGVVESAEVSFNGSGEVVLNAVWPAGVEYVLKSTYDSKVTDFETRIAAVEAKTAPITVANGNTTFTGTVTGDLVDTTP